MEAVLDLVAVTYNAPRETGAFLKSLRYVDVPFSICVIDNASPDPMVRQVVEYHEQEVARLPNCVRTVLVFNERNVGYARACNHGATRGSAPYIGLLNADTQFLPGAVGEVLKRFRADGHVAVVGPRQRDSNGRLTHAGIVRFNGQEQHRYWLQADTGQANDTLEVPTVSGSAYFVRRDVWTRLTNCFQYRKVAPNAEGAFLPTPHYFEERYCSEHARMHGYKVIYAGAFPMIHEWHKSSPFGGIADSHWDESQRLYQEACRAHQRDTAHV